MRTKRLVMVGAATVVVWASSMNGMAADSSPVGSEKIKHVLLLSIDGMHAVDFYNCANGIAGVNGGSPFCPNMAKPERRKICPGTGWAIPFASQAAPAIVRGRNVSWKQASPAQFTAENATLISRITFRQVER